MNVVVSALRAQGIAGLDVQTAQVGLEPNFRRDDNGVRLAEIDGYIASNRVTAVVRNLADASKIVTAVFDSGANSVDSPRFGLTDESAVGRQARERAVADARTKAVEYAAGFGLKVGRVLRIDDTSGFVGIGSMSYAAMDVDRVSNDMMILAAPIEAGELTISSRVGVRFVLVPN